MKTVIVAAIFATIGIACAAQSTPLSPPEKRIAKADSAKSAPNAEKSDQQKGTASNINVIVEEGDTPKKAADEQEEKENIEIQRKLAYFTGGLVLVGLLQTIVLGFTLSTINRQAEIAERQEGQMAQAGQQTERIISQMKDTAQRQLRAYMGVSKIFLNLAIPTIPQGSVEVKNFGQTPAYKVRQWIGITMGRYPLTSPLQKSPHIQASVAVVSPGVSHASVVSLKKAVPENVVIGTLETTVYVYGEVIYEDAFGEERHTEYRFIYGGPESVSHTKAPSGALLGVMKPDVNGNEAD
jgi:hypothetical protein